MRVKVERAFQLTTARRIANVGEILDLDDDYARALNRNGLVSGVMESEPMRVGDDSPPMEQQQREGRGRRDRS